MRRPLKILLYILASILALIVIAAITLMLVFDKDDFREQISTAVYKNTGRELVIEGDLEISVFPWLAIDVGASRLGNAAGFGDEPFARFERARLSVRLMPMIIRQEIAIGTAAIDTLQLNLAINDKGRSNWQDLLELSEAAEAAPESSSSGTPKIDIASIEVRKASVSYSDAQSGDRYKLTDFNLVSGAISGNKPVKLDTSFGFDLHPAGIAGTVEGQTVMDFDTEQSTVTLRDFALKGLIEGITETPTALSVNMPSLQANTASEMITLSDFEVSVVGVDVAASVQPFSFAGSIEPKATVTVRPFSPRSVMERLAIEVPVTADPNALGKVSFAAKVNVTEQTIGLTELLMVLDDTTLKGGLTVPRTDKGTYRFDLTADTINLDRYMAPAEEGAETSDAETEIPVEIPSDLIRPLNARGTLKVGEALLSGIRFESVVLELTAANGDLRLHPISAGMFSGEYQGDVRINVAGNTPVVSVDEKINAVQLAPLARAVFDQDNISGSISGAFKLTGKGKDMSAVQRSMNGNMSFELLDGTFEGTDVWYEIRRARALLKQEPAPEPELPARTKFSSVTATGVVTDGVFNNDDLLAELPFLRLGGKGSVNLAEATTDYRLTARVLKRPESTLGMSKEELDDFTEAVIPVRITGPLSSPSVKPDVGGMIKKEAEKELKKQLTDKLLGGKNKKKAEGEEAAADEQPPKEESVEDVAKKALLDMLNR